MENEKERGVRLTSFDEVEAAPVEWLWEGYIARGKITVIQGDPGNGKTALAIKLAALFSRKLQMPTGATPTFYGNVLYQSGEDDANDTIKPRLVACGADCKKVAFAEVSEEREGLNPAMLEEAIRASNAAVAIVDPFQAFLGIGQDITRVKSVRPVMKELGDVATRTNAAIIIIGHMNKNERSKGLYRGLGTIDITAAARSVLLVGKKPDDHSIRVVTQIKSNLGKIRPPVAFMIGAAGAVEFLGECDVSDDELLGNAAKKTKLEICTELISSALAEQDVPSNKIYEMCMDSNIMQGTIETAKRRLGIKSVYNGKDWCWTLNKGGDDGFSAAEVEVGTFAALLKEAAEAESVEKRNRIGCVFPHMEALSSDDDADAPATAAPDIKAHQRMKKKKKAKEAPASAEKRVIAPPRIIRSEKYGELEVIDLRECV